MLCGDGRPVRLDDLVVWLGFPKATVAHTCNRLVHAGLLESRRGAGGGYRLARSPDQIGLLEIFDVFDPGGLAMACGYRGSEDCRICSVCRLRKATEAAYTALRSELAVLTVADFAVDHGPSTWKRAATDEPAQPQPRP
jgi:Rrf2 family protein